MLFEQIIQSFLYSRKHGLSGAKKPCGEKTIKDYEWQLRRFFTFLESKGRTRYQDILRSDIRDYIEHVNSQKDWSAATKLTTLRPIRTLCKFVEQDEECVEAGLKSFAKVLPKIPKNPRREDIPTVKDLKKLRMSWNTASLSGLRNYVVNCLILSCGARIGEICWLRLDNLQLEQEILVLPKEGKTGTRVVPLEPQVVGLLKTWLKRRDKIQGAASVPWMFLARGAKQCTPNTFGQAFRRIRGEGSRISAHTLRHAFGTYYLRNGGNMERLRMTMGHTTYDTLKGYLHLAEVGGKEAKQELERVSPLKMLSER
jgi:site-specific recombinase XerD